MKDLSARVEVIEKEIAALKSLNCHDKRQQSAVRAWVSAYEGSIEPPKAETTQKDRESRQNDTECEHNWVGQVNGDYIFCSKCGIAKPYPTKESNSYIAAYEEGKEFARQELKKKFDEVRLGNWHSEASLLEALEKYLFKEEK